jgi:hypothetical protein
LAGKGGVAQSTRLARTSPTCRRPADAEWQQSLLAYFWQSFQEAEDQREQPRREKLRQTAGATLHVAGKTDIV